MKKCMGKFLQVNRVVAWFCIIQPSTLSQSL
jgi:hypothetical protein